MSRSLAMYADIQSVLDAALAVPVTAGEVCGRVPFETYGKAVHWRQRAYAFRKLWRERMHDPHSRYDLLTFPKLEKTDTEVVIKRGGQAVSFLPAKPIGEVLKSDPLLDEAKTIAQAIDKGDLV